MPAAEQPRERLRAHGVEALSDSELVALLLGTGSGHMSVLELARHLLGSAELGRQGLERLQRLRVQELAAFPGIGEAKAMRLVAACELGRRLQFNDAVRQQVRSPKQAIALLSPNLKKLDQEHFMLLLLDTKKRVLGLERVAIGTLDSATVHPREVFRLAIGYSAATVILAHNHPSGDPTPSPDDIALTRRLAEAGRLLGIEVVDHVVVGHHGSVSFVECGIRF